MVASGARIDLREEHVHRNLHVRDHVPVSYLDVLHFGWVSLTFEGLNTDQLDFNGLDLEVTVLHEQVAIEALGKAAVDGRYLAKELKLSLVLHTLHHALRFDRVFVGDVGSTMFRV